MSSRTYYQIEWVLPQVTGAGVEYMLFRIHETAFGEMKELLARAEHDPTKPASFLILEPVVNNDASPNVAFDDTPFVESVLALQKARRSSVQETIKALAAQGYSIVKRK